MVGYCKWSICHTCVDITYGNQCAQQDIAYGRTGNRSFDALPDQDRVRPSSSARYLRVPRLALSCTWLMSQSRVKHFMHAGKRTSAMRLGLCQSTRERCDLPFHSISTH